MNKQVFDALDLLSTPVAVADLSGKFVFANAKCYALLGEQLEPGQALLEYLDLQFTQSMSESILQGKDSRWQREFKLGRRKQIYEFHSYRASNQPLIIVEARDISQQLKTQYMLQSYSKIIKQQSPVHDSEITSGVLNRCEFFDQFSTLGGGEKYRCDIGIAQLDGFDNYLKQYGQGFVDQLVSTLTSQMLARLPSGASLSQLEPNKFCILGSYRTDAPLGGDQPIDFQQLINDIQGQSVLGPDGQQLSGSISIGVAQYGCDGFDLDGLINSADCALSYAKGDHGQAALGFSKDLPEQAAQPKCPLTRS